MRKTSLYLDAEDRERLRRLAAAEGRSQAEVVREAIRGYEVRRTRPPVLAMEGVAEGPGGSVADVEEADLLRDFGV
jgi:predicted transcriptional regulator